jgi:hypothetical protein
MAARSGKKLHDVVVQRVIVQSPVAFCTTSGSRRKDAQQIAAICSGKAASLCDPSCIPHWDDGYLFGSGLDELGRVAALRFDQ